MKIEINSNLLKEVLNKVDVRELTKLDNADKGIIKICAFHNSYGPMVLFELLLGVDHYIVMSISPILYILKDNDIVITEEGDAYFEAEHFVSLSKTANDASVIIGFSEGKCIFKSSSSDYSDISNIKYKNLGQPLIYTINLVN